MVGNARQDFPQVSLRIEPVELGRLHQAVDRRGTLAAGIRAEEQEVLAFMLAYA